MVNPPPPFSLFTTLRYDPRFIRIIQNSETWSPPSASALYMLAYHRDRIVRAAQHFRWHAAITAFQGDQALINLQAEILSKLDICSQTPMRVKILVHHHGTITIETSPTPPVDLANLFPARIPPPASAFSMEVSPLTGGALTIGCNDTVAGDPVKGEAWVVIPDPGSHIETPAPTSRGPTFRSYDIVEGSSSKGKACAVVPNSRSSMEATGGAINVGGNDAAEGDLSKGEPWVVTSEPVRTKPTSYTKYKTTNRDMYDVARERVGIRDFKEKREVLIVSERDGEIMEGSLTNCYFWRGEKWVTPSVECGGQIGTVRRWLLEKGLCVEGVVKVNQLVDGEECWLSNGVRGLVWGKIQLQKA